MSRNTFPARYDGRCRECGETIVRGDLLTQDSDDNVIHADCTDTATSTRPAVVCTTCFTTKATNGACACEEWA